MELIVVLLILVVLAGILVPLFSSNMQIPVGNGATKSPQQIVTEATMKTLRDTIVGTPDRPGYWNDILPSTLDPTQTPLTIKDLFTFNTSLPASLAQFDPSARRGWRGPYLLNATGRYPDPTSSAVAARNFTADYGLLNDPCMLDGWGNPIVIQWPTGVDPNSNPTGHFVRLVSAGPNGILDTPLTDLYLPGTVRGDDIVLYLRRADIPTGPQ
jgi:hypothetical protein